MRARTAAGMEIQLVEIRHSQMMQWYGTFELDKYNGPGRCLERDRHGTDLIKPRVRPARRRII
jgi:hypothetical protein